MHYPDFETFSRLAQGVHLVPVYRRLIGDLADARFRISQARRGQFGCLFESVVGGEKVGPVQLPYCLSHFKKLKAWENRVVVRGAKSEEFQSPDPIEELRKRIDALRAVRLPEFAPVRWRRDWLRRLRRGAVQRNGCRMRRKTIGICPTCRLRFTIGWWCSTTSRKRSLSFRWPGSMPAICGRLMMTPAAGWDDTVKSLAAPAADLTPVDISPVGDSKLPTNRTSRRRIFKRRLKNAWNTFGPAIFSRL